MADTTPIDAIDMLQATDGTDNSLISEISQSLGLMTEKQRYERWKEKLRKELVREHISAEQKNDSTTKSFFHKLFKKG